MGMGERLRGRMEEVMKEVREVTVDELQTRVIAGEAVNIIDVRDQDEWDKGHIPGAQHMGRGTLEFKVEHAFPDEHVCLVLHCGGGTRSALAALSLQAMGYDNVFSLQSGFRGWLEAGGDVVMD